ncbi:hypothetical protein HDV03_002066 [Kappamyces sp. JEL0829]|nr:hypothetical protein HDV03_002066 [Kappamyces sp. JEL0829]
MDMISEFKFAIHQSQLLWYEKAGLSYQEKTEAWRYPIPEECPAPDDDVYSLEAEWIVPDIVARYSQKSKRRTFGVDTLKSDTLHSPRKVLLYLHGGAYILGNIKIYRSLTGILAKNSGHPVLAVNYRMAPENPFPAGLHDALAAYLYLLKPGHPMFGGQATHEPYEAKDIIIAGDSAGGGLTMALLNYLNMYLKREDGTHLIPLPRGVVLLSPWVDLTCSSKSWEENKGLDFLPSQTVNLHEPVFPNLQHPVYSYCFGETTGRHLDILTPTGSKPLGRIPSIHSGLGTIQALSRISSRESNASSFKNDDQWLRETMGEQERDALERFVRHPLVSPIFGDFSGLCPILIQVGECEMLRDESIALAYKYQSVNGHSDSSWVRHELYVDMVHDFQVASIWVPAAKLAIKQLSHFVGEMFGSSEGIPSEPMQLTLAESKLIRMIDSHIDL